MGVTILRHEARKFHMKRRLIFSICATLFYACHSVTAQSAIAQNTKPNIILILADDLGYADIGVQAVEKDVLTPNIDSIARNGVRFTQGYVSCPVCSPSRAGILTGKYQERFGHESNPVAGYDDKFGLPKDQVTLADEMKRIGYATAAFGKWHEGNEPGYFPLDRGFDDFFGFLGGMHSYFQRAPLSEQGFNAIRRGNTPVEEKEYLTDAISREAVSFIDKHQSAPFFMYVAYNAVHVPQAAPPKYQNRFPDVTDRKRKMMLAMLSAEDDGVGAILSKIREHNLEENTLVIFLSDNGGPTNENGSRNAPLRGYKGQVWEGGIRIPFMMQWKGKLPAGKVLSDPVISLDLFPTTIAAAGAEPRKQISLDGVNLLPYLNGETTTKPHETLYWRFLPQWAIRDGALKLEQGRDGVTHLFDLERDPTEKSDLFAASPEIARQLQSKFEAWNKTLIAPLWPGRQEGANDAAMVDAEEATADAD
jgi:arylsulfatase A-like enzyme